MTKKKTEKSPEKSAEEKELEKLRTNYLETALAERLKMASGLEDMWRRQVKRMVIV